MWWGDTSTYFEPLFIKPFLGPGCCAYPFIIKKGQRNAHVDSKHIILCLHCVTELDVKLSQYRALEKPKRREFLKYPVWPRGLAVWVWGHLTELNPGMGLVHLHCIASKLFQVSHSLPKSDHRELVHFLIPHWFAMLLPSRQLDLLSRMWKVL